MSDDLRKKLHGIVDLVLDGVDALELVKGLLPDTLSAKDVEPSTTPPSTPSPPSDSESSVSASGSSCGGELNDGSSVQAAVYPRKSKPQ